MGLLNKKKKVVNKDVKKTTVQDSVPYIACYENGVFQSQTGLFTKMMEFNDISFTSLDEEKQEAIYKKYMAFLNTLSPDIYCQLTFVNHTEDGAMLLNDISPVPTGDKLDVYRKAYTDILSTKIDCNKSNIITHKYITIGVISEKIDDAMNTLSNLYSELEAELTSIKGVELKELTLAERLEVYHNIYNGQIENLFFVHDSENHTTVDFKQMHKKGITTKELISPEFLKFDTTNFQIDERFGQSLYLSNLPNYLSTNFVREVCTQPFESVVTIYINQMPSAEALKQVHDKIMTIGAEIDDKESKAVQDGKVPYIPYDLQKQQEAIDILQEDLNERDQKVFYFGLSITHFANDKKDLINQRDIIRTSAEKYNAHFSLYSMQQERGFNACIPWGYHSPKNLRILTTEELGIMLPFDEIRQFEKDGFYYGINKLNKNCIVYNRKKHVNSNGLILGSPGSGKSMFAKEEIMNVIFNTNDKIYVFDPDGEYGEFARAMGGEVIDIYPGTNVCINPLDLDIDKQFDTKANPLAEKVGLVCSLIETMQNGIPLNPIQLSVLTKCINAIYRPYLDYLSANNITYAPKECPTLQNLFLSLQEQHSEVALQLSQYIEPYVSGPYACFARATNVNTNNRFIVFNIKEIGEQSNIKELAEKIILSEMWNRCLDNRRKNFHTWMYIDEFHLIMSSELSSEYVKMIWKRCRKFWGLPCGITQNVEDLLASPVARTIINLSDMKVIMQQSVLDSDYLQKLCNLSVRDIEYIQSAKSGQGLISTSMFNVGFDHRMPKDNPIYNLLNTTEGSISVENSKKEENEDD